jgi:hypothetical protein
MMARLRFAALVETIHPRLVELDPSKVERIMIQEKVDQLVESNGGSATDQKQ